jgi:amidase
MSKRQFAHFVAPTSEMVEKCAARVGVQLDGEDARLLPDWIGDAMAALEKLEDVEESSVPIDHTHRDPGKMPGEGEDPHNAFVRFCDVRGAGEGSLKGKRLAVKDCIAVAGVPQSEGGGRRPYFVPTEDAVVIERVLRAGATIVGKTNMEDMAVGSGEGSYFGAARNPLDPSASTGGSSSGSAAAVASGMVDMALGVDQAGSIRIPAAWCGLVGMKATHGLVPSYGLTYMDHTLDHIGPITTNVEDNAQLLEVIAGEDWRDPQWLRGEPRASEYLSARGRGLEGTRVGFIRESVSPELVEAEVLAAFRRSLQGMSDAGAIVQEVSVSLWPLSLPIFSAVVAHGLYGMWLSNGLGFGHLGRVDVDAVAASARRSTTFSHHLPPRVLVRLILAQYLNEVEWGVPLAKAHNLRLRLRHEIDSLFTDVDLLVTPTVPTVAFPLLEGMGERADRMTRGGTELLNTCPLDLSGHPALSVPCGVGRGDLPVGIQIIGPRFGELAAYGLGFALEEELAQR